MNCRKCGANIADGQNFCAECGAPTVIYRYEGKEYQKDDILKIAKYQIWFLYAIMLFLMICNMLFLLLFFWACSEKTAICILVLGFNFFTWILYAVAFCLLCSAEKRGVFWAVLGVLIPLFFPVISFIIYLSAIGSAANILRAAGLKVGLMGVSKKGLDKFRNNL